MSFLDRNGKEPIPIGTHGNSLMVLPIHILKNAPTGKEIYNTIYNSAIPRYVQYDNTNDSCITDNGFIRDDEKGTVEIENLRVGINTENLEETTKCPENPQIDAIEAVIEELVHFYQAVRADNNNEVKEFYNQLLMK